MTKTPDWLLEKATLGELSASERASIDDPNFDERVRALAQDNAVILAAYAPHDVASEVKRRVGARVYRPARALGIGAGVALLASVAAVVIVRAQPGEDIRFKGAAAHLTLQRQRGAEVELLHAGDTASAGDRVQIMVTTGGARYGVVLSVDGRGVVTLHYPSSENGDTALPARAEFALPFAYTLDDAPRFERFILITSPSALDPHTILAAARAGQPLAVGTRSDFTLVKK
jgi:hypothetical protein